MNQQRKRKNWLEWVVFSTGLLLVGGLAGYLVYDLWAAQSGPPIIEVRLGEPEQRSGHHAIPVTVENRGHATAEQVHVQVTLEKEDGHTETADFTIQFVPRGASRHGTVSFQTDPSTARRVTPRVLGYVRP